jgi:hypothetical protein
MCLPEGGVPEAAFFGCGELCEIDFGCDASFAVSYEAESGKISVLVGSPPHPPSKRRDWRGVCKNGLQNLERLGVRSQNLENKGVKALFTGFAYTASALAMICCLDFRVKGGCHITLRKT